VVLLAARGSAEVRDVVLEPAVPAPPGAPAAPGWTPATLAPAALALAFAALAALLLRLPFLHLLQACAFAAPVVALGLLPDEAGAAIDPLRPAQVSALASLLLLVPCLAQWPAFTPARAALLVLAALGVPPAPVSAASPPVAHSGWFSWSGERLEDELAYLTHPVLRTFNGYLADHRFRGRASTQRKPADTLRVVTLGGSSTWGYAIPEGSGQEYPMVLERLLVEDPPRGGDGQARRVEVINGACLQATGERQLRILRDGLLAFEPDVVTLSLYYNDCFALTTADAQALLERFTDPGYRRSLLDELLTTRELAAANRQMATLDVAYRKGSEDTLAHWQRLGFEPGRPTPPQRWESLLRRFAELARERGFGLVLVKEPVRDERHLWKEEFYAVLDRLGAEYGVPVVDPGPALAAAGGAELFMDPVHLEPPGLEIVARELAPVVRAALER
jgi:lysophospholipase L1-like esterase